VIDALAERRCWATAQEIAEALGQAGSGVGLASVYRTLNRLDALGLAHRLDIGDGTSRYEPAEADGHHHHHAVCDECGQVASFEDDSLERSIADISRHLGYAMTTHDVVLHGRCPDCRTGEAL